MRIFFVLFTAMIVVLLVVVEHRENQADLPEEKLNKLGIHSPQTASLDKKMPRLTDIATTTYSQNIELDGRDGEVTNEPTLSELNELNAVATNKPNVIASPIFHTFTHEHPKYTELLQQYEAENGPFVINDVIYMSQFKGTDIYFVGFNEATVDVMFSDPDQYLELLVADFSTQTIDQQWDSNWGELQGIEAMTINYQYCKTTTCLVHASYNSMGEISSQVDQFKADNPKLYIEEHIMTNGSMVLKYSKLK